MGAEYEIQVANNSTRWPRVGAVLVAANATTHQIVQSNRFHLQVKAKQRTFHSTHPPKRALSQRDQ